MVIEQMLIKNNRPFRKLKGIRGIVVHWTANTGKGADALSHYKYFNRGYVGASAHYMVDQDRIVQLIPDDEVAWHVGDKPRSAQLPLRSKVLKGSSNPNDFLIGIEMCVNAGNNWIDTVDKTIWLISQLMDKYNFTVDDIYRHYDITGKDCPKMYMPVIIGNVKYDWVWQQFKNQIIRFRSGL